QGMVGDDDFRRASAADVPFDEAFLIVRTSSVDALAALVGQTARTPRPDQIRQPRRKIAADHVAVPRSVGPSHHQPEGHRISRPRPDAARGVIEIKQAEIVLAPLSDDDLPPTLLRVRKQAAEFAIDLMLKVPSISGDPDWGAILLRPDARGRDVAERLSDARSGFGDDEVRLVRSDARLEGGSDGRSVVGLTRPRL